jgi:hypothetical protein
MGVGQTRTIHGGTPLGKGTSMDLSQHVFDWSWSILLRPCLVNLVVNPPRPGTVDSTALQLRRHSVDAHAERRHHCLLSFTMAENLYSTILALLTSAAGETPEVVPAL